MGKRRRSGCMTDSGAKKSDGWESQEEIETEGGMLKCSAANNGVRYSARVMEKQEKLRREASPGKTVETGPLLALAVTTPVATGRSREESGCLSGVETVEEPLSPSPPHSTEKRKKRNWELWSQDDKQLFFEALNEFGKEFEAIQNHLASKLKGRNKGPTTSNLSHFVPKNKDQVRHFYYRTWNKISKFLTFPKEMKKAFQELYGLINYGELRKKQRVLNSKSAVKLFELVEKGTTTIKVKGKTCRIKTPVCRALKRLNRVEDVEPARMPHKVVVELIAKDGRTWRSVQALAHNPRIRVALSLQRTLASVITFFEDRWKSSQDRLKEQLSETFGGRTVPRLRFVPVQRPEMSFPIFKVSEATSSAKISLRAYKENILKTFGSSEAGNKKGGSGRVRHPSEQDKTTGDVEVEESKVMDNGDSAGEPQPTTSKSKEETCVEDNHSGISTCVCPSTKGHGVDDDFLSHIWDEDNVRRGWTAAEAGIMTFGELYLMLGQCEKIELEYYWVGGTESTSSAPSFLIDRLISTATLLKKKKSLRSRHPPASHPTSLLPIACPRCSHAYCPTTQAPGKIVSLSTLPPPTPVFVPPPPPRPPPVVVKARVGFTPIAPAPPKDTFRRPSPPRSGPEQKAPPPKPFLVLPKGNRRLGRPAAKRVIPRVLPLRPKLDPAVLTIPLLKPLLLTSHLLPMGQDQVPIESTSVADGHRNDTGPISLTNTEFEDLLKPRSGTSSSSAHDVDSTFSFSSFMETSSTDPSRNQSVCLSSDKFLNEAVDADHSNSGLSLSHFLNPTTKGDDEQNVTGPTKKHGGDCGDNSRALPSLSSQGPWLSSTDTGDLSLSSLLVTLCSDSARHNLPASESGSDMTFQSLVGQGEGSLNFLTKFSQDNGEASLAGTTNNSTDHDH